MSDQQGSRRGVPRPYGPRTNGFAVASLVLAIIAISIGVLPLIGLFLSFVPCVLAVVFGILGIQRADRVPGRVGYNLAVAGLVVAGITFLLYFTGFGLIW